MIDYDSFSRCHLTDIFFLLFTQEQKRYNPFLNVLLLFNKMVKRYELLRFYQMRKTEKNAFRLLCSETDQKAQF